MNMLVVLSFFRWKNREEDIGQEYLRVSIRRIFGFMPILLNKEIYNN